ncbi:SPFH domain-containing protein [Streptomyces sp. NPDC056773]|uniref:SPFH domain-containing protein n=1 Tax=unclassified Streptomyces TaxID=2593676 RepID=UPI00369BD9E6
MYPTRTTSTTGTFEIPPHPTPRPATPDPVAEPHPEPAPAAAGWEASGEGPDRGAHPSATPDHTEPYGAPPAPSAASMPGPGQAGAGAAPAPAAAAPAAAGAGAEPTPAAAGLAPAGTTADWAAPERTVPDRAAPVAAAAAPTAAGTAAERAEPAPASAGWVPAGTDTERAAPERAVPDRGEPALAVAMPVGAGPTGARAAADGDVHLSAGPDRAGPVQVGAVPTPVGAERDAHWSAVPDRGEQALAAAAPVGAGVAGGVADGGVHLSVAPDRAEPVSAAVVPVGTGTAGAVAERGAYLSTVSAQAVPEAVGAGVSSVSAAPVAAAGTGWAGPVGWAPAAEPAGPAREEARSAGPVRGEAGSAGPARDGAAAAAGGGRDADGLVAVGAVAQAGPAGRGGEGARSDVPAARAQAEPPVETLRLRTPGAETARPHPQDEVWPPAAPRGPRHAGPPAAWDLPGQGGSSPEQGRAPQHAVPAPAPEAGSADPSPVRDLPEQGEATPADGGRELTWSVPAPAAGADDDAEPPGGIVPGPGIADGAEVAEVVARAVARIGEDDTQDLPRVAPARGVAVTEVPVHLPFRGAAQPQPKRQQTQTQEQPKPKAEPRPKPRSAPGRRVPRGDDRLHEHHGPVLPGWIAVTVGGIALAGCAVVLWRAGAVPDALGAAFGAEPRPYRGLQARFWPPLAFLGVVALLALGGLGRGRAGHAWVLTLFGRYRGTVRRTGLTWISPLLLRRRVDVRLRHWRSDPMPAVDSGGLALQVVVQVVWQVKDTARATLAVEDHVDYLAEQVESAMARVLSQLPADAFHEDAPTLRDAEAVGDALTRMLAAETEAVGVEVFSAQPTRIEYAPEVADAMRRRRVAAIDAKHRDTVLTSVVDAVDDTVHRLTSRGIVELDDYERKALVKDLTVAFYTGRSE